MAVTPAHVLHWSVDINMKTVGNTEIIAAQAQRFHYVRITWYPVSFTGTGTKGTLSIGTNSGSNAYNNLYPGDTSAVTVGGNTTNNGAVPGTSEAEYVLKPDVDYEVRLNLNGAPLIARVQTASTYTTDVIRLMIVGTLKP